MLNVLQSIIDGTLFRDCFSEETSDSTSTLSGFTVNSASNHSPDTKKRTLDSFLPNQDIPSKKSGQEKVYHRDDFRYLLIHDSKIDLNKTAKKAGVLIKHSFEGITVIKNPPHQPEDDTPPGLEL